MKKSLSCEVTCIHRDEAEKAAKTMPGDMIIQKTAKFFKVFGDPTRLSILLLLKDRELCVCDIAYILDMTQSSISHQLSMLRKERVVKYRKEGKTVFYSLDDEHVPGILDTGLIHIREDI